MHVLLHVELFKAYLFSSTSVHAFLQMCLTLCNPMDCSPPGSSVHGIPQARILECHALLQGIFLIQGLNPHLLCLLHWQVGSLPLVPPGKPRAELYSSVHEVQKSIITHKHGYLYDHFSPKPPLGNLRQLGPSRLKILVHLCDFLFWEQWNLGENIYKPRSSPVREPYIPLELIMVSYY